MMILRARKPTLLTVVALALVLVAPARSLAAEEATTTSVTPAPEQPASSTPTSEAPTPSTSTPTTPTPTTTETAPTTSTTPPPAATTPQVSGQSSQGATPAGSTRGRSRASGAPKAGGTGAAGPKPGGTTATPRRGKRAPKPSALTPPLPLSLSSSIAGVPAFFIESFRIPPFLLPIYQAAGTAYGVPWQVLAAINEVETDYGRDLSVSSAGAEGWMQFLPSSWAIYGVDANGDGYKDPYNPADAIFAAARYLRAAGAATDLRGAIFSYNHSQAYVESVMLRAKLLGGTPSGLLGAITGLTESRFPVHAKSHFTDGFPTVATGSSPPTTSIPGTTIYSEADAPVIAVQDGEVVQIGDSPELGHFISLRDAYGNTYTYAKLGSVAQLYPVLEPHDAAGSRAGHGTAKQPPSEPRPTGPASAGTQSQPQTPAASEEEDAGVSALSLGVGSDLPASAPGAGTVTTTPSSAGAAAGAGSASGPSSAASGEPDGTAATGSATPAATAAPQSSGSGAPRVLRDGANDVYLHDLHSGVQVIAGTVLGHVGPATGSGSAASGEPSMIFQIRPAGAGAPLIDPKPILDGWVQLENSSVFRASAHSPFTASGPSAGQVLLESKEQLEHQVLDNPEIDISKCGRQDIEADQIDRRVLATLEFLAVSGLHPTVSGLKCGDSVDATEGNVSERASGDTVDISAINGTPIAGHQGPGSVADTTIRKLLTLQGPMKPHRIISLMSYPGAGNTLARAADADRIQIDFEPADATSASLAGSLSSSISPSEWIRLIDRLGEIPNPTVASGPSSAAIPDHAGATSGAEG
jgi:Transglycosylase SLT domain